MPATVSYVGVELEHIIVGPPGPNLRRRTTNWCTCKCGRSEPFMVTRSDIQQAIMGNRGLDPRYSTLKPFVKSRRKKVLSCRCKDFDLTGEWFGLWLVLGPGTAGAKQARAKPKFGIRGERRWPK
jgi:hypothetical protein